MVLLMMLLLGIALGVLAVTLASQFEVATSEGMLMIAVLAALAAIIIFNIV